MKPEFLGRASQIAADNISSQQQILKDMLDLLLDFSSEATSLSSFAQDVKSLSTSISNAQSQMSALSNISRFVVSATERLKPGEIGTYLKSLRDKVETASSKTAYHASRFIKNGKSYATISQSEFVTKTFEDAAHENKHATVFVMESRPLFEGRQTAKGLAKMGHHPVLVSDASIGLFINEIDAAFIGADSILSDGVVVNKVGSYPLAACCAEAKKDFYVVTSILKYDSERKSESFINKEENPSEIFPDPEFEARNFYYDKIGPKFITAIITEVGIISPVSELDKLDSWMLKLYSQSV
jgi:translation initiation factor 2B subunit (eIF-2B alpha/beta/delta family)